jgi:ABC-type nitrate/sulfonate/bicarbonate transport system ATPase subunit/ABC-type nitrate/sulfonate/bicarbonate transport system permease component
LKAGIKHSIPKKATIYSILLLIVLWQGTAMFVKLPELFPSVTDLIAGLLKLFKEGDFYISLANTILRGILGFIIALALSFLMAAIALHHDFWKAFFHPLLVTIRSIPVISLVLVALLWLSPPGLPIFIAFFTMFPILYQNILSGLEHTDEKLIEMAVVFRKTTLQRFFTIYLPASHTLIFSGIATAMGFGWRAVIIGEVLATPIHGIGTGMKKAQAFIDMRELLAWTVVAILVSFAFDYFIKLIAEKQYRCRLKLTDINLVKTSLPTDKKQFEISHLNKSFNNKTVINNFSTQLSNDAVYLLKSSSGSGKTTLMRIIAGLTKKDSGTIHMDKHFVLSYSFQDARLIPWLSTEENIAFALPCFPKISTQLFKKLNEIIDLLELTDEKNKLPDELSGGQQQRVALARALIVRSDILLLDEPLSGLGQALKNKIVGIIENHTAEYKPIILWATHEDVENQLIRPVIHLPL